MLDLADGAFSPSDIQTSTHLSQPPGSGAPHGTSSADGGTMATVVRASSAPLGDTSKSTGTVRCLFGSSCYFVAKY